MFFAAPINEPPLPRRKKCPELAYKTNEFMSCDAPDGRNTNVARARVRILILL